MANLNKCPYCGESIANNAVACPKCGHLFFGDSLSNQLKKKVEINPEIREEDYAYLKITPKKYKANVGSLIRALVSFLIFGVLLAGVFVAHILLKDLVALNEKPLNFMIYVYLGVLLVLPWLFFISLSIAKGNLERIKYLPHSDGFSVAGKVISIIMIILSVCGLLFGLVVLVIDAIQVVPIIIESFQNPS